MCTYQHTDIGIGIWHLAASHYVKFLHCIAHHCSGYPSTIKPKASKLCLTMLYLLAAVLFAFHSLCLLSLCCMCCCVCCVCFRSVSRSVAVIQLGKELKLLCGRWKGDLYVQSYKLYLPRTWSRVKFKHTPLHCTPFGTTKVKKPK